MTTFAAFIFDDMDERVPSQLEFTLEHELKQKNADVSMETISKSNHLFEGKLDPLMNTMTKYIEKNKS